MSKKETVEEFLQRGGTITKVPAQASPDERKVASKGSTGGLMSLADGSIFYSEIKEKKPKKKKAPPVINIAALPASLLKFVKVQDEGQDVLPLPTPDNAV